MLIFETKPSEHCEKPHTPFWPVKASSPPTLMLPLRDGPLFGAKEMATVPLPEPGLPDVMLIQLTGLFALQLQVAGALTGKLTVPPAALTF